MTTLAVLLGASEYKDSQLNTQSGVFRRSMAGLAETLVDVHGFEPGITLFDYFDDAQHPSWSSIQSHLARQIELSRGADANTLIIVHIGHGVRPDERLRLALPASDDQLSGATSLTAEGINSLVCRYARAWSIYLIVDACFAGSLVEELTNFPDQPMQGISVLAAADATTPALADPGSLYTGFMGAVIDVLQQGIEDRREVLAPGQSAPGPDHLTLGALHEAVRTQLSATHGGRIPDSLVDYVPSPGAASGPVPPLSDRPIWSNPATNLRSIALCSSSDEQAERHTRLATGVATLATTDTGEELSQTLGKAGISLPRALTTHECVADAFALKAAIGKVAAAELFFADITDFEPVTMFLLGIRSTTKRGVTVCTGRADRFAHLLKSEPFHLRDVPLTSHGEDDARTTAATLAQRALAGFNELRDFADDYTDLPAFNAVRQTPQPGEARLDLPWDSEALALCPFSQYYVNNNWTAVRDNVKKAVAHVAGHDRWENFGVKRTIDLASPRVVTAALFDYIRRSQLCIVDLTSWRAGVLFELGVRYASSRIPPICLIDAAQVHDLETIDEIAPHVWESRWSKSGLDHEVASRYRDQALALVELLGPVRYEPSSDAWRPSLVRRVETVADPFTALEDTQERSTESARPKFEVDPELRWLTWRHADAAHERHANLSDLLDNPVLGDGGRDESGGRRYLIYPVSSPIWEHIGRTTADRQLMALLYLTARLPFEENEDVAKSLLGRASRLRVALDEYVRRSDESQWIKTVLDAQPPLPSLEDESPHGEISPAVEELLEWAKGQRARSRQARNSDDLEYAGAIAEAAAASLAERLSDQPIAALAEAASELWGEAAGSYRRQPNWREAHRCYERGAAIEQDERFDLTNSYLLTNSIVALIMSGPEAFSTMLETIASAAGIVKEQVRGPRRSDFWAWADAVLLLAITGGPEHEIAMSEYLERGDYQSFVATAEVMEQLGGAIPDISAQERLASAVKTLRGSAARL